jgi:hypothetical protein
MDSPLYDVIVARVALPTLARPVAAKSSKETSKATTATLAQSNSLAASRTAGRGLFESKSGSSSDSESNSDSDSDTDSDSDHDTKLSDDKGGPVNEHTRTPPAEDRTIAVKSVTDTLSSDHDSDAEEGQYLDRLAHMTVDEGGPPPPDVSIQLPMVIWLDQEFCAGVARLDRDFPIFPRLAPPMIRKPRGVHRHKVRVCQCPCAALVFEEPGSEYVHSLTICS